MARGFVQQNNNKIIKPAATKGEDEQSVCAINPVVEFLYFFFAFRLATSKRQSDNADDAQIEKLNELRDLPRSTFKCMAIVQYSSVYLLECFQYGFVAFVPTNLSVSFACISNKHSYSFPFPTLSRTAFNKL